MVVDEVVVVGKLYSLHWVSFCTMTRFENNRNNQATLSNFGSIHRLVTIYAWGVKGVYKPCGG